MMRFVIDNDDVFLVAQFAANAPNHLIGCFGERTCSCDFSRLTTQVVTTQNVFRDLACRHALAQFERMKIGDDDFGFAQFGEQVRWNDVMLAVIVLGIVREKDAQTVADGDTWRDDQKRIGETRVLWIGQLVQCVPSD